jgi:hypothetical protein
MGVWINFLLWFLNLVVVGWFVFWRWFLVTLDGYGRSVVNGLIGFSLWFDEGPWQCWMRCFRRRIGWFGGTLMEFMAMGFDRAEGWFWWVFWWKSKSGFVFVNGMIMLVYVYLLRIKFICVLGLMLTEIGRLKLWVWCGDTEYVLLEFSFGLVIIVDVLALV